MSRALRRQRQKALPLELAKRSIFDYAPLFRVCFLCPVELPARDWRPELLIRCIAALKLTKAAFLLSMRRV